MQVLVDLNRCQSYGQCVFAAPRVFRMDHSEALEWDYEPDAADEFRVVKAMHACPVQAITIGYATTAGRSGDAGEAGQAASPVSAGRAS